MPLSKEEKEIKTIFIILYILTASYATEHKENSTLHREVKKAHPSLPMHLLCVAP